MKRKDDDNCDTGFQNRADKFLSFKVAMGAFAFLLLLLFAFVGNGMVNDIKSLQKEKLDKEQYYRDLDSINKNLNDIANYLKTVKE